MSDGVLNNESSYAVWVRERHAKTNGTAVILHVKRIPRESERFGKVIHDFGDVIEYVCEFFRIRPVAVPESRVIRSDKMKSIRKPGEEWLEHPGRRWQSVEQENRWRILRPRFPIKDCESINLYGAIKSRGFHGTFLSLSEQMR